MHTSHPLSVNTEPFVLWDLISPVQMKNKQKPFSPTTIISILRQPTIYILWNYFYWGQGLYLYAPYIYSMVSVSLFDHTSSSTFTARHNHSHVVILLRLLLLHTLSNNKVRIIRNQFDQSKHHSSNKELIHQRRNCLLGL